MKFNSIELHVYCNLFSFIAAFVFQGSDWWIPPLLLRADMAQRGGNALQSRAKTETYLIPGLHRGGRVNLFLLNV